jgi:hypothetical protein
MFKYHLHLKKETTFEKGNIKIKRMKTNEDEKDEDVKRFLKIGRIGI